MPTCSPEGAVWRKWDLHIHTAASYHWNGGPRIRTLTGEARTREVEKSLAAIRASDVSAFAIMDYWTFDGYLALRELIDVSGGLSDKLLLPGIELRVESPVGHRLHIHAVLSDKLSPTQLHDFLSCLEVRIGTQKRPLSQEALIDFARQLGDDQVRTHGEMPPARALSEQNLWVLGCKTVEITR